MGVSYSESQKKPKIIEKISLYIHQSSLPDSIIFNKDPNFIPLSILTIKDDIQNYYKFSDNMIKKGSFGLISEGTDCHYNSIRA